MTDWPSVLISVISSDIIRDHLNAIHSAKEDYMADKVSEKIQKVLRHKVRLYAYIFYNNGYKVYYQHKDFKCCMGLNIFLG